VAWSLRRHAARDVVGHPLRLETNTCTGTPAKMLESMLGSRSGGEIHQYELTHQCDAVLCQKIAAKLWMEAAVYAFHMVSFIKKIYGANVYLYICIYQSS
jgi:hypothetical protein